MTLTFITWLTPCLSDFSIVELVLNPFLYYTPWKGVSLFFRLATIDNSSTLYSPFFTVSSKTIIK